MAGARGRRPQCAVDDRGCAQTLSEDISAVRALVGLLPADEHPVRLVVDTNSLIDNPDLAAYVELLGPRYVVHVLPVVLREVDDLKRAGRHQDLREAARRAERRLKGAARQRRRPRRCRGRR